MSTTSTKPKPDADNSRKNRAEDSTLFRDARGPFAPSAIIHVSVVKVPVYHSLENSLETTFTISCSRSTKNSFDDTNRLVTIPPQGPGC